MAEKGFGNEISSTSKEVDSAFLIAEGENPLDHMSEEEEQKLLSTNLKRQFKEISPAKPNMTTFGNLVKSPKSTVEFAGDSIVQEGGGSTSFGAGATMNPAGKQSVMSSQAQEASQLGSQWTPSYVSRSVSNEMLRDQVDPTCKEGIASVVDFNWGWRLQSVEEKNRTFQALARGHHNCCQQVGVLDYSKHFCRMSAFPLGVSSLTYSSKCCNQCNKVFQSCMQMKYHGIRVHGGLSVRVCPICLEVFLNNDALGLHLSSLHGGPQVVDDIIVAIYGKYSPFE